MMKLMSVWLLVGLSVQAQNVQRMGFVSNHSSPTMAQEIAERHAQAKKMDVAAAGTNLIRLVEGQAYQVLKSTNWMTLPGLDRRGKFSRSNEVGVVFELEQRMTPPYGASYHVFEREVIIKNYPVKRLIAGDAMPAMRVMPIFTTPDGLAVYDFGTSPVAARATNAPPVARAR